MQRHAHARLAPVVSPYLMLGSHAFDTGPGPRPAPHCEQQLHQMLAGLRASGGVVEGDALALLLRRHLDQPVSWVARGIVQRKLVHFKWRSRLFIPLFQFDRHDMSLRPGVPEILALLTPVCDDWDLARWFAQPNTRLRERVPAEALATDAAAVLHAAHAHALQAPALA